MLKPAPLARAICNGSNRNHAVVRWPKGNKVQCSHCSLKLVSVRVIRPHDLDPETGEPRKYMEVPSHRPVGAPKIGEIDWSMEG